jgi:hypothetical protein
MYLQIHYGWYYKITSTWCYWVESKEKATKFDTAEAADKAHNFHFNFNKAIKVTE